MRSFFLSLHMVSMCLVIGTLFLQSLSVVFRLRLKTAEERAGLRNTQVRIHKFIYYPILFVTVVSGLYLAINAEVFTSPTDRWIYPKLTLLLVLVGLGVLNGAQIKKDVLPKKYAMMVHIAIFIVGATMIYFATIRPF